MTNDIRSKMMDENGKLRKEYHDTVKWVLMQIVSKSEMKKPYTWMSKSVCRIIDVLEAIEIQPKYFILFRSKDLVATFNGRKRQIRYIRSQAGRFTKETPFYYEMTNGREAIKVFEEAVAGAKRPVKSF